MKSSSMRALSRALARGSPLRPSPATSASAPALLSSHRRRPYSTHPPNAKLNLPTDYSTTPLLSHTSQSALANPELPPEVRNGTTKRMNLFQAVNDALSTALAEDESVLIFGEDVAFGGVFRCTGKLAETYGGDRVFNTPLTEQGIMGFAIGVAAEGMRPVAEIQFADYVYPAFDQLVNEAAKFRYRDGSGGRSSGGLTVRMPCGGVGHGALYHSQSPESLFTHIPGLRVIMPRSPLQAKGLLLAAIRSNDPCVFMEPKILYRAAVEQVPTAAYTLPLSKAEVLREGSDVTIISYGQPLYKCEAAIKQAERDLGGVSVELIDLRTIYPWDKETVFRSVRKTGRCLVVHEAMVNAGVGAEVAAAIQEDPETFVRLEAPVARVAGFSIHTPLLYETLNAPDVASECRVTCVVGWAWPKQGRRDRWRHAINLTSPCPFPWRSSSLHPTHRPASPAMSSHKAIVSSFVEGAPPGELADVIADIKSLTISTPNLVNELGPAFQKYNEEQLTTVKLPGSSQAVIVSAHSALGGGRYYDVESSCSFAFDHATQKASAVESHVLDGDKADLAKSVLKGLSTYVKEHFTNAAYGAYPVEGDSKIAIIIVANKYSPNNFWNGRWRSVYLFDPASNALEGTIKVDVHYYEDGNVRLLTSKAASASVPSGTGAGVAREIALGEKKYQEELNRSFTSLSEGAFKALRRQLPVTRQKIEWDKVASYRLGQDIGGGAARR
ncbi:branched chain alpha-keto acid dehydrogenase e1 subunit beta [Staphylotrichum tortipilum]|uniref:F-actin-capping protein subunit alpha n=1 Tax=Staphylotrichum tortipilum TaxID=2831512 RepID=A0AAN6RWU0_9PEZI|nr:branched chain alpha-keto acid dehydrogenase e1 subunit beta [Staphylotrichum longicolle]